MKMVKLIRTFLLLSLLSFSSLLLAQNTGTLSVGTDTQPREGKDFAITVTPSNPTMTFNKVIIGYRLPNDEYVETEMRFDRGIWKYTITADYAVPPRLDYYIVATQSDGTESTYPAENYRQNPAYINISPKGLTDAITVMMGEDGSKTAPEDFMIMISYYTISDQIDVNSVKLIINGNDVTKESSVTADALNYLPASPAKGKQSISFEAKLLDGTLVGPLNWSVSVVSKDEAKAEEEAEQNYSLSGNVWNEYRYENTASGTKATDRANASANGNIHWLTYNINLYKSSEESKWKQTNDRYTLKLGTEYLDLTFGDAYPSFSRLMMNGSRVRGAEVNLKTDYINVDFAYGYLRRAVDTRFAGGTVTFNTLTEKDSIDAYTGNNYVVVSRNGLTTTLAKASSKGAYDRNLMAGKLSFGSKKQGFNWGMGFLKSIDDTTSNKYGDEAKANVVMSTDMQLRYDNGRFELYGDAAFSLDNTDIKFTSKKIDSVFKDQLKGAYKTVNSIIPLTAGISAPGQTTILDYTAFLVGLKLNYWNNYLKVEYLRNGSTFHSEGLPFFQNDIQGLKLNDRLRLFQNKLFLTFGYDLLFDNTDGGKDLTVKTFPTPGDTLKTTYDGTTTRNNIRTGFAVFPGAGLPSFSFDYIRLVNQNEIPANETASQDNASNTFQISTNYGFNWLKAYHSTSLSFALTKKADLRDEDIYLKRYALASTDQEVRSIVLSYGTTIGEDLNANLSFNNSTSKYKEVASDTSNTFKPGDLGYGSFKETKSSFNIIEGSLGKAFLNNKLRATARANATFSDLNQYIFGASAQYYFYSNLFATSDANYILNEGEDSDFMFTLRLQYVF